MTSAKDGSVQAAASLGTSGPSGPLPYFDTIQRSFGKHDVSHVAAHTDAAAERGARMLQASAFTTGNQVAFARPLSLHTAAHEAAHVVQQRSGLQLAGGVGVAGDRHERHADAVAARVSAGQSSEALLDEYFTRSSTGNVPLLQRAEDDQSAADDQHAEADKPSSEGSIWDWIGGVLAGDFEEDPSIGQNTVRTLLTLIPYVDQVADLEDLAAALYKLIWQERYDEFGPWVDLTLTAIGLIPELGSLIKGVAKGVFKAGKTAGEKILREVLGFLGDNLDVILRKAEDIVAMLPSLARMAVTRLYKLLDDISGHIETARSVSKLVSEKALKKLDEMGKAARRVKEQVERRVAEAVEELRKRIAEAIARARGHRVDVPPAHPTKEFKTSHEPSTNPPSTKRSEETPEVSSASPAAVPANVRPPATRHYAKKVDQGTVAKNVNSVLEPRVDVNADIQAIRAGAAQVGRALGGETTYTIRGRTYGIHPNGTLYPMHGDGVHVLDRGGFKALGVYNKFGDTPRAEQIIESMGTAAPAREEALSVWRACQ